MIVQIIWLFYTKVRPGGLDYQRRRREPVAELLSAVSLCLLRLLTGYGERGMIGDRGFERYISYDSFGRVKEKTSPSYYTTVNNYDNYGNLTEVTDNSGRSIWKALEENALGQYKKIIKGSNNSNGGKITEYTYDPVKHTPESIIADGVINYWFGFNNEGNLQYREDKLKNQREGFLYDTHNRLTNWDVTSNGMVTANNSIAYNPGTGNIDSKSDLGNVSFKYGNTGKPHALDSIVGTVATSAFPTADLNVTYTDFKKIKTLSEGSKYYNLDYGVDDQRRKSEYKVNGVTQETRYYLGDYEEVVDANGNTKRIHYISGGDGLAAILELDDFWNETMRYAYTDYQGSLIALTDESGNVVERYAYDPWGARRNPENWAAKDTRTGLLTNRGYTGHEHIDAFGIINMNGRVYDPATAMFMSPDPYVQAPSNWLNYNRYGYCYGNPFRYSDPSGEFFWIMPYISWSPNGGVNFGISVGIGIPGVIGANVSIGGGAGGFNATAGGFVGPANVYAGYSSQGGFIAGAGVGFGGLGGGFNTNMTSVGINFSHNGGLSYNAFSAQFDKHGTFMGADPSIGYCHAFQYKDLISMGQTIKKEIVKTIEKYLPSKVDKITGTNRVYLGEKIENLGDVQGLTLLNFEEYEEQGLGGPIRGVDIDLKYTGEKANGANFVQKIYTTDPSDNNVTSPYFDGDTKSKNFQYYYDSNEIKEHTKGNTVTFSDAPGRPGNARWCAVLSLRNGNERIFTLMYGFSIYNGKVTLYQPKILP